MRKGGRDQVRIAGIFSGFIPPDTTWAATDKYSVVINATRPWVNVFDFLSLLNIVCKEFVESPDASSSALGTGPFKLAEWAQGDHATYAKNPNYWSSGRPYLDAIQLSIARDAQAQQVQFEAGAVDFTLQPSILDFERLKSDSRFRRFHCPIQATSLSFSQIRKLRLSMTRGHARR